jgi:hypothetical protein
MFDERRHSIIAGDDGEGTPNTSARSTATTFRQLSGGRRATTHRQGLELQRLAILGKPLGKSYNISGEREINNNDRSRSRSYINRTEIRPTTTMNYIEIKQIIESR